MLGYCGMNCAECPSYTTTVSAKKDLREKTAASCSDGASGAPEWVCLGCTPADQQFLSQFCVTCKVRGCAIAKELYLSVLLDRTVGAPVVVAWLPLTSFARPKSTK